MFWVWDFFVDDLWYRLFCLLVMRVCVLHRRLGWQPVQISLGSKLCGVVRLNIYPYADTQWNDMHADWDHNIVLEWVWVFFLIGDNYVYQSWYELNFWQSQFIICETYGCQSVSVYELMTQILWFRLLTELLRVSALTLRISGLLKPTVSVCWKWKWLISINIWIKIKIFLFVSLLFQTQCLRHATD